MHKKLNKKQGDDGDADKEANRSFRFITVSGLFTACKQATAATLQKQGYSKH
jgi:hypothetical protein